MTYIGARVLTSIVSLVSVTGSDSQKYLLPRTTPALLTRISTGPISASTSSALAAMSSGSPTLTM